MSLTIALAKGRIWQESQPLLGRVGLAVPGGEAGNRRLKLTTPSGHDIILAKGADVPTYVEYGTADLGICGRDVLLEVGADVHHPMRLPFGYCRLVVAGLPGRRLSGDLSLSTVRVATKYPRIAERHFRSRGVPVEVVTLSGSVELAPLLGLADCILDVVQTGETLRENGLVEYEEVEESSAQVIVNRASYHLKQQEILTLLKAIEKSCLAGDTAVEAGGGEDPESVADAR